MDCFRSTACRVGLRADTVSCHVIADKLNCQTLLCFLVADGNATDVEVNNLTTLHPDLKCACSYILYMLICIMSKNLNRKRIARQLGTNAQLWG